MEQAGDGCIGCTMALVGSAAPHTCKGIAQVERLPADILYYKPGRFPSINANDKAKHSDPFAAIVLPKDSDETHA